MTPDGLHNADLNTGRRTAFGSARKGNPCAAAVGRAFRDPAGGVTR